MIAFVIIVVIIVMIVFYCRARDGRYQTNEFGVYRDKAGKYRMISNGSDFINEFKIHPVVYYTQNAFGEEIIRDANTQVELVNCDYERAKHREEEAKRNGQKFFVRCDNPQSLLGTYKEENAIGIKYSKVGEPFGTFEQFRDVNGNLTYASFYVKRTIRYNNKELGISDYRGTYYFRLGKYHFDIADDETIQNDISIYGEEKAKEIEELVAKAANDKVGDLIKQYGISGWIPYQPKFDKDFCIDSLWNSVATHETIKNWH